MITLCMIVKDECKNIKRCLMSVLPSIDRWVICDTGSTDGTQVIIEGVMREKPGRLFEYPWVDYSTNRNQALDEARAMSERGDYIFMIDASDVLHGRLECSGTPAGYQLLHKMGPTEWFRPCLFRKQDDWKYHGKVHEAVEGACRAVYLEGPWIECNVGETRKPNSHYQRFIELLLPEAEKGDPRSQFYLAQSYGNVGNWAKAEEWYKMRMNNRSRGQGEDERWFAMLQYGILAEDPDVLYICAEQNLTRAEPYYHLALLAQRAGQLKNACFFASLAIDRKNPSGLFIDRDLHGTKAEVLWTLIHYKLLKRKANEIINTVGAEYPGIMLEIAK